jgi:uncharacterized membrane protein
MTAGTMELTNFHLGRKQKVALKQRAKANGTNVAEELRTAVDAYLSGVTPQELALLDAASRNAEKTIQEMNAMLDATNRRADQVFTELERMRGAAPAKAPSTRARAAAAKTKRSAR